MADVVKTLQYFGSNATQNYQIGTDAQYVDTLSGLNLQYNIMLGGNKTIVMVQHSSQEEVTDPQQSAYTTITPGTIIPPHLAIKQTYNNPSPSANYIVHYMLFYKINGKYPDFLGKSNVIGYVRIFEGSMSAVNKKYEKYVIKTDTGIEEEVPRE